MFSRHILHSQINIIKEDSETYTKFLILIQKYEHNTNLYRDTLLNCECNICLENKTIHTFYRYCEHYFCSDCYVNWNIIKKTWCDHENYSWMILCGSYYAYLIQWNWSVAWEMLDEL